MAMGFDLSHFDATAGGTWSLNEGGDGLVLTYAPAAVPEPGATAAVAGLGALGLVGVRRWRLAGKPG